MKHNSANLTKVLIELPTWLGDAIMATPAIENIIAKYDNIEITLIGSFVSTEALKNHPKVTKVLIINKRYSSIFKILQSLEKFDIYFSFRNSFRAKILKFLVRAKDKYQFNYKNYSGQHQVEKYANFINNCFNINLPIGKLNIHKAKLKNKKINSHKIGLNPGATYGSAKRWYPDQFAKLAIELSKNFDVIILGGNSEIIFANEIESILKNNGITNYKNLAGKTTVTQLIEHISNLDLFVTGDSGPMHIAACFSVPTVCLFGPTNFRETAPWRNDRSIIISKKLNCQPCMKRICPLKHHNCMRLINSNEVISSINKIYPSLKKH